MEIPKDKLLKLLGARIKELRRNKGVTQKELALRIGKDTQAIERLERGGTNPTFYFLYQVSIGLDVPLQEIVEVEL